MHELYTIARANMKKKKDGIKILFECHAWRDEFPLPRIHKIHTHSSVCVMSTSAATIWSRANLIVHPNLLRDSAAVRGRIAINVRSAWIFTMNALAQ
jgi:maleate cis-trans isomerase